MNVDTLMHVANNVIYLLYIFLQKLADEYYKTYNNTTYNSIETDICHLVYVGQVEMLKESEVSFLSVTEKKKRCNFQYNKNLLLQNV